MKKAFIFDMDGVIVDSERFYHKQRMGFLELMGLESFVSDPRKYVGASFMDGWKMMVPDENMWGELLPKYKQYFKTHRINYADYVHPYVGKFLNDLKNEGMIATVASAGPRDSIVQMMDQCNFHKYFDSILSGESVQNNKPAPDIYLKSVEKIGIDPIECVALEDSSIGINAAKNAGLETWALNYPGYSSDQSKADYVFNGFGEVCNYFEKVKKI